jgi:hypothetical protein
MHKRWVAILVAFIFAPTISVLEAGQITPIILVGIVGFLFYTIYDRNDWIAGAFLFLASVKPQIALLFWIALLLWIILVRRWKVIVSAGLTTLFFTIIALVFNPHIIQHYLSMFQTYQISDWASPTIGAYLRFFIFGVDKFWLQFLPAIFGVIWLFVYWIQHRNAWDWLNELPKLLLVSIVTSFYSWTYDFIILLPAVLQAAIWILPDWKRLSNIIFIVIFLVISILDLILHMKLSDFWFIWMGPVLLIWFLVIRWQYTTPKKLPQQAASKLD